MAAKNVINLRQRENVIVLNQLKKCKKCNGNLKLVEYAQVSDFELIVTLCTKCDDVAEREHCTNKKLIIQQRRLKYGNN